MNSLYVKLARINIKNNKSLYLPYLLSGMMTVAMFYLMVFLSDNDGLNHMSGGRTLTIIFRFGIAVIGIFSYIFIFYTNSFIIKRRKREIGVYNILGMEKRHIAKVLGLETIFVAVTAIVGGVVGGILFSKLMLMLLFRILQYGEQIVFSVAWKGIELALVVFGILYALTLIYNLMQIKIANPIELLRGGNVGEKEPKAKWISAIFGVACIAIAYYISITTENPLSVISLFFIAVMLVIAGTYSLFTAGSIVLLKGLRANKKFYYNPKHFTAVSGMIYRMKQNAAGLASICILSTMVLVMISTTVSMYAGLDDELKARYPMDVVAQIYYQEVPKEDIQLEEKVREVVGENGQSIEKMNQYEAFTLCMAWEGETFTPVASSLFDGTTSLVNFITRESLLELDDVFKEKMIPEVPKGSVSVYSLGRYEGKQIEIMDHIYPVYDAQEFSLEQDTYMTSAVKEIVYIVVDSNQTLATLFEEQKNLLGEKAATFENVIGIDLDGTDKQKIECSKKISAMISDDTAAEKYVECRQSNREDFFMVYGGMFFLGIFLGIIFLTVTVMIIFYKQISEGYDDKKRYEILEKVGMSNREVKDSIRSQVRIVFFLPLLTAAVHMAAAFPMIIRLLSIFNMNNHELFAICLLITFVIFAIIYYVVFKITSRSYYKIVGNQI